jgi:hypothetical protein
MSENLLLVLGLLGSATAAAGPPPAKCDASGASGFASLDTMRPEHVSCTDAQFASLGAASARAIRLLDMVRQ